MTKLILRRHRKHLPIAVLALSLLAYALPFRTPCLLLLIPPFVIAQRLDRRGQWNAWLWIWVVLLTGLCAYTVWPARPSVWVPRVCGGMGVAAFLGLRSLLLRRLEHWPATLLGGLLSVSQWLAVFPLIKVLRYLCRLASPDCGCD